MNGLTGELKDAFSEIKNWLTNDFPLAYFVIGLVAVFTLAIIGSIANKMTNEKK